MRLSTEWEGQIYLKDRYMTVMIKASGNVYRENYGADADGNRGEMRTECDDLEITISDMRGNDITAKVEKRYPEALLRVEDRAISTLLDEYECDTGEPEDTW